jgi:integrase
MIENCSLNMKNPCSASLLSKSFKMPKREARKILDKETVDEMIYNAKCLRDRLILEFQARCGLRIGEVLSLRVKDISDRKLLLQGPKSGKEGEVAFMPEQVAKRLIEYINKENLSSADRLFPICYSTARSLIRKSGEKLNVKISPHDLRRHSATYASRNGVPLEIISKVILRHQDLKTTQMYLGKVSDTEAIRWMDTLHER